MFGAILQAALTLLLAASLATYLWLRAARAPLRSPLIGLLGALILWSGGVIWRFTGQSDADAWIGLQITWLGVAVVPPLWLLLALRHARIPAVEKRPALALVPFVPSAITLLALVTNPRHHLFFTRFSHHATAGRGPLFYAALTYGYALVGIGIAVFVASAWQRWSRRAWQDSLLLVLAAVLPTLASAGFVFGWTPLPYDPTPAAFGCSLTIFTFGVFRYQLLDTLPFARGDVIDHLRDGVVITDRENRALDANPSALAILGRPAAKVRGARLAALLEPLAADDETPAAIAARIEALPPDAAAPPVEFTTRAERRLEVAGKCVRDAQGEVLGRFVLLRDRTEERRVEQLLRQSQRLETVGQLVAGVAHEVNNPLAFVQANLRQIERLAALAAKHPGEPDRDAEEVAELPQIVAECIDGIERIERIVDSMRRFSRAPSDEFVAVDINRVVDASIRLADLHRSSSVAVDARLASVLPPVHGSAARLEQVFVNLLVNAKQALANRPRGRVEVATRLAGDIVQVRIEDDGPGIPEPHRERIFDPFFTTKAPEQGTGLGLSIAFDIVREHGGVLELRRASPGACFVVHLPLHPGSDPLGAA
jgi:PAS domain S-box-containing protein